MSLSNPVVSNKRPVDWYVQWNGGIDKGNFTHYEKSKVQGQKGTNHEVDLKNLIVLDHNLFSITGYRERDGAGIGSNEVRSTFLAPNAVLEIHSYKAGVKTTEKKGTYAELKDWMKDIPWANYTACIYGYLPDVDKVIHLQLSGIAFSMWGKITGVGNFDTHYLSHTGTTQDKKGTVDFKYPTFSWGEKFKPEHFAKAIEIDQKIQVYLKAYLKGDLVETPDETSQEVPEAATVAATPTYDTKKWREYEYESGKFLGQLKRPEIKTLEQKLVDANETEGVLIDCIGQALHDYQTAEKTWSALKDKDQRPLGDYNLDELEEAYKKLPYNKEVKIKVELAIESVKSAEVKAGSPEVIPAEEPSPWD